jgi:hypothetical protein
MSKVDDWIIQGLKHNKVLYIILLRCNPRNYKTRIFFTKSIYLYWQRLCYIAQRIMHGECTEKIPPFIGKTHMYDPQSQWNML